MSLADHFADDEVTSKKPRDSISISEFLNTSYRDYALYVLYSRAIPSMIDGFKPGQRKAVCVANQIAKSKRVKTSALAGAVPLMVGYHHGDGSLGDSITKMAGTWNNNLPIFLGEGNFGSRLVNEPGATRYTKVQLAPAFDQFFKDEDVLESAPDPEDKEPRFYLPLIPWVLVNGSDGVAIGYATEIRPRDPKLLAKVCADFVSGKLTEAQTLAVDLPPHYEGFTGKIYKDSTGKWRCQGKFEREPRNWIRVTEVPIGTNREKYVTHLAGLQEKEKITEFVDRCSGNFDFRVKVNNAISLTDDELRKLLSLDHGMGETIRVIDESGSLRTFGSPNELLVAFCKYRIQIYPRRFAAWEKRDQIRADLLSARIRFIALVIDGSFSLRVADKKTFKAMLAAEAFEEVHYEDLMDTKAWHFSTERLDELNKELASLYDDLEQWKTSVPAKVFEQELRKLTK